MSLSKFLTQGTGRLDASIQHTQQEVTKVYREVRDDIRKELAEIYDKYAVDGVLTSAEMTKYNRLATLEKNLTKKMRDGDNKAIRLEKRLTAEQYNEAFFKRAWAIDNELGARMSWGLVPTDAVDAAVNNNFALIARDRLKADSINRIRTTIAGGIARGDSYTKMAREVGKAINGTRAQALRIVRTEAHRSQIEGTQRAYERAEELGIAGNQYWIATLDGRVRDSHGRLDGKPRDKERGGWRIPGTNSYAPGPSQSGIASFDINCRCDVEFRIDDEAPEVRRIRDRGVEPYITYEEWKKQKNKG